MKTIGFFLNYGPVLIVSGFLGALSARLTYEAALIGWGVLG